MARKVASKPATRPDKALVEQVTDEALASYEANQTADAPGGTQAALLGSRGKAALKKVLQSVAGNVLELALMAGDGRLDLAEARRILDMVVEAASRASEAGDGPAELA